MPWFMSDKRLLRYYLSVVKQPACLRSRYNSLRVLADERGHLTWETPAAPCRGGEPIEVRMRI